MTGMTDIKALEVIRANLAPYAAHTEKDRAVEHIIARLREPAGVGGDWVLVPREATDAMKAAGFESGAWDELSDAVMESGGKWPYSCRESADCVTGIFGAMLAAAPQPPAEAQAQGGGEVVGELVGYGRITGEPHVRLRAGLPVGTKLHTAPPSASVGVEVGRIADDMMFGWRLAQSRVCEKDACRIASNLQHKALAQQPAAVDGAVLHEYIEARDAYEAATRPPNSHAPAPRLKHGDPIVLRYRKARAALHPTAAQEPAHD